MSDPLDPDSADSEGDAVDNVLGGDPFEGESADHDLGPDVPKAPEPAGPTVETPTSGGLGGESGEVDTGLRVLFWKLVLLYKVSILGVVLGALLLVFDRGPDIGPELLAGALVLFVYTLYKTRRGKERVESGEFHDTGAGES